jgi:uncharacterized membrane protein
MPAQELQTHGLFTIARSPHELKIAWRDPDVMTRFFGGVRSVVDSEGNRYRFVARDPADDSEVQWDVSQDPTHGQVVEWRGTDPKLPHRGLVTFEAAPGNRGTVVSVSLFYEATEDDAGLKLASAIGKDAASKLREDLRRFKQLMEAGVLATVEGQTSGREITVREAVEVGA